MSDPQNPNTQPPYNPSSPGAGPGWQSQPTQSGTGHGQPWGAPPNSGGQQPWGAPPRQANPYAQGPNPYAQATSGQPMYGSPQPPYGSQGYQQSPYSQPLYSGQPSPGKASPKVGIMVVVGIVVLALAAGIGWFALGDGGKPAPSPSVRPSLTPTAPTRPTTGGTTAPGKGTVASIRAYLDRAGYMCTNEAIPGIASAICLLRSTPESVVYYAGMPNGGLGRIAHLVRSQEPGNPHKKLAKDLLTQFIGDEAAVGKVLKAFASGTSESYADYDYKNTELWGDPAGSMVLIAKDWLPSSVKPGKISVTAERFTSTAKANGYTCEADGSDQSCKKQAGTVLFEFSIRTRSRSVSNVGLWATGPSSEAALKREGQKVLTALGPDGIKTIAMVSAFGDKDGYKFAGGLMFDYYRKVKGDEGKEGTGIHIRPSCVSGDVSWC